jgi:hypothetical protein
MLPNQQQQQGVSSGGSVSGSSVSGASEAVTVNPRRSLINPKFILTVLKGVTHRFLLAMESESRNMSNKSKLSRGLTAPFTVTKFPPRFTVGGPRASKDPRATPIEELIEISSARPEIQLPSGTTLLAVLLFGKFVFFTYCSLRNLLSF